MAREGWRECVCRGWKLGDERTLEADSCNTDPTSLQAMPARAWGERFLVSSRKSCRVGRIEEGRGLL